MKMLTAQQIFNKSAKGLLAQNKKSEDKGSGCRMRKGKLRCAVGFLISDTIPTSKLDNIDGYLADENLEALLQSGVDTNMHENLLGALMDVHDEKEVSEWPKELAEVARKYNLKMVKVPK